MQGERKNKGKPRWSLVSQSAFLPMVEVLEYGCIKYSPNNWKQGLSITEICESLKRHLDAFMEGEDNDKESEKSHIGHIQCNAMFLSWMLENRKDLDDRDKTNYNKQE
ncbi:MAG: dATP/dGTP diphosphohydrolase domain-containing protein [Fusobacteriaceae bacterium]